MDVGTGAGSPTLLDRNRLPDTVKQYFGELLGTSNKKEGALSRTANIAMEILHTQPGAEYAEGSWWSALNAVTYYVDHKAGRDRDASLQSAWFGPRAALKRKALNLAVEFAQAA